jgi:hypothetical protein
MIRSRGKSFHSQKFHPERSDRSHLLHPRFFSSLRMTGCWYDTQRAATGGGLFRHFYGLSRERVGADAVAEIA